MRAIVGNSLNEKEEGRDACHCWEQPERKRRREAMRAIVGNSLNEKEGGRQCVPLLGTA